MASTEHPDQAPTLSPEYVLKLEIESAVSTARAYPRDIRKVQEELLELATMDEEVAAECWYTLPRANKKIIGPSVRLAEMAVSCWGHIDTAGRIVEVSDTCVKAEAVCRDLQKNVRMMGQALVRIVDKDGKRYNEDGIQMAQMNAQSKAIRNAIFKVIPKALINSAMRACMKRVEDAQAVDLEASVNAVFERFEDKGVKSSAVLKYLNREKKADVKGIDIINLRGIYTAMCDGYVDPSAVFGRIRHASKTAAPLPEIHAHDGMNETEPTGPGEPG